MSRPLSLSCWCSLELLNADDGDTALAVAMLQQLTRLSSISAFRLGEEDPLQWEEIPEVQPPPLAQMSSLTKLRLHWAQLPPDWRQLSGLQSLRIGASQPPYNMQDWGQGSLAGLSSLTRLELANLWRMPGEQHSHNKSAGCRAWADVHCTQHVQCQLCCAVSGKIQHALPLLQGWSWWRHSPAWPPCWSHPPLSTLHGWQR
jgi:hypothetical protein